MNQETFTITEEADAKYGEFVILCRKVRLWIAAHPGCTSFEIQTALGRSDSALGYLYRLGLIRVEIGLREDGRRARKWYVVPQ